MAASARRAVTHRPRLMPQVAAAVSQAATAVPQVAPAVALVAASLVAVGGILRQEWPSWVIMQTVCEAVKAWGGGGYR